MQNQSDFQSQSQGRNIGFPHEKSPLPAGCKESGTARGADAAIEFGCPCDACSQVLRCSFQFRTGMPSPALPLPTRSGRRKSTAWPSWTLRAPGHEGDKCWYPSTRAAAHEHRNPSVPKTQSTGAKEQFEREVDVTGAATPGDTVQAPGLVISPSFDDRFSAMGEEVRLTPGPNFSGSSTCLAARPATHKLRRPGFQPGQKTPTIEVDSGGTMPFSHLCRVADAWHGGPQFDGQPRPAPAGCS